SRARAGSSRNAATMSTRISRLTPLIILPNPPFLSSGGAASTSAKARERSNELVMVVPSGCSKGAFPRQTRCHQREAYRTAHADGDAKLVLAGRDRRRRGRK